MQAGCTANCFSALNCPMERKEKQNQVGMFKEDLRPNTQGLACVEFCTKSKITLVSTRRHRHHVMGASLTERVPTCDSSFPFFHLACWAGGEALLFVKL